MRAEAWAATIRRQVPGLRHNEVPTMASLDGSPSQHRLQTELNFEDATWLMPSSPCRMATLPSPGRSSRGRLSRGSVARGDHILERSQHG